MKAYTRPVPRAEAQAIRESPLQSGGQRSSVGAVHEPPARRARTRPCLSAILLSLLLACGTGPSASVGGPRDTGTSPDTTTDQVQDQEQGDGVDTGKPTKPIEGWPLPNDWTWDGSWVPAPEEVPPACLLDDKYNDGHELEGQPTPILPPGSWDWADDNGFLAHWRNFAQNVGDFEMLRDETGLHYGWRFVPINPEMPNFGGAAMYFEGSCGVDQLILHPGGRISSMGELDPATGVREVPNLADGPDVLVFETSATLDIRLGSSLSGHEHDNDLVVGGGGPQETDDPYDITTTTVHMGPGRDWVFIRDLSRSAVDLGNGEGGRTDVHDPDDGDDLVILRGNTHDFRVFGGAGDDVAVWYADENLQASGLLGPNFFGGGGLEGALWEDQGTDRLVMAVPTDTILVNQTPTPVGAFLVGASTGGLIMDDPTAHDPYAYYCIECGVNAAGRRTMIFEYNSADGEVTTGYFYVTAFEELQIGLGPEARVFTIDDVNGTIVPLEDTTVFDPPDWPDVSEM